MQEQRAAEQAEADKAAERQAYLDDPEREAERQRAREGGFMEDVAVSVRDSLITPSKGDQRSREEIASDRADAREGVTQRFQETQAEINQSEDIPRRFPCRSWWPPRCGQPGSQYRRTCR